MVSLLAHNNLSLHCDCSAVIVTLDTTKSWVVLWLTQENQHFHGFLFFELSHNPWMDTICRDHTAGITTSNTRYCSHWSVTTFHLLYSNLIGGTKHFHIIFSPTTALVLSHQYLSWQLCTTVHDVTEFHRSTLVLCY